ncbi:MAG: LPS assembly lipoprotein LptE [Bacteriovoracia bacterium]
MQTSSNPVLASRGVKKVYIQPIRNETYKAGVENVLYNAVLKRISTHAQVKIVHNREDADAILTGIVEAAAYNAAAGTNVRNLPGASPTFQAQPVPIDVASVYGANLACTFALSRTKNDERLWGSGFSRSRTFPANNQLGVLGTTSALINDSEFDRAISELADEIAGDVHESMFSMF